MNSLAPLARATDSNTSPAWSCGTDNAGTPDLYMPALLRAISSIVLPSTAWWSRPKDEIPVVTGLGTMLVESYKPPMPTSSTVAETPRERKAWKASSVSRRK